MAYTSYHTLFINTMPEELCLYEPELTHKPQLETEYNRYIDLPRL
jgi:hypothetical protein